MTSQAKISDDLKALNQIAETLNRAVDVQDALQTTLARLVGLMGLDTGWIFVRQPAAQERWAGKGYVLAADYDLPPAMDVGNPEAWKKGCDCQALCNKGALNEAYNEVRCSRLAAVSGDRGGLAVHASTPLRSGDTILGILNVAAPDWDSFSPRALALLTNVGSQMGIALERARLFELLQEQRIHEQMALLDLSNQLLAHLDLDELIVYLVEEVRRLLQVDACALLLPGHDPDYLYFRAAAGWLSQPVANQYRVPADERSGSGRVMQTQQPLFIDSAGGSDTVPWMADWLEAESFRQSAIVPLVVEGRSIGVLVIHTRQTRQFDAGEVRLLRLMANQAAIAIEKTRLHREEIQRYRLEEELTVGRRIQLSMLPPRCPVVPGWDLSAVYEAARQVGGDFYDFFELPDDPDRLGMVIADVSGKGVPAALYMALSRTTIRNTALRGHAPAEALTWANRFVLEDSQSDMFLSAFYATLDVNSGRLHFANAGHNRPLWWRAETRTFQELDARGMVLGVLEEVELEERQVEVASGDVLVLYTDGVTEAVDETYEEFGQARLRAAVADTMMASPEVSADAILNAVLEAVRTFIGSMPQHDDFTLVVVRREPESPSGRST
jgi:sigma-B regulation protein RsbU (phosphoserine phosphatase)